MKNTKGQPIMLGCISFSIKFLKIYTKLDLKTSISWNFSLKYIIIFKWFNATANEFCLYFIFAVSIQNLISMYTANLLLHFKVKHDHKMDFPIWFTERNTFNITYIHNLHYLKVGTTIFPQKGLQTNHNMSWLNVHKVENFILNLFFSLFSLAKLSEIAALLIDNYEIH